MALLKYKDKTDNNKWKALSVVSSTGGVTGDLEISEVNRKQNLHLIDTEGNRVGKGVDLEDITESDIVLDDDIILDDSTDSGSSDGFDIILDDDP